MITLVVAVVLTGATYALRAGELGFLQQWFAPGRRRAARAVRRELEPAADLRLHRWPHLPRPARARNRLVGRASARGVRAVPPGRAETLSRPARPLLPAREWIVHPAADVRPGRLRARHRRHRAVRRSARDRSAGVRRVRARVGLAATPTSWRRTWRRRGWRRSSARSPARRSSAARRWRRSSGSRSGSSALSRCSQ